MIFKVAPLVQCQNDKRLTSQPAALLDEGFHGTPALVGSLAISNIGTAPDRSHLESSA